MEKHQLSKMIAGLSVLVAIISVIVPLVYAGEDSNKDLCKENGGDWEDGSCDFEADDEDKVDSYTNDLAKIRDFEEERAAEEDALCDDPDANFEVCQSATLAFADKDKDEDELTERDVDLLCDASEDYEAHKEQCDKLYDKVQDATLAFASKDEDYSETEEWNEKDYQETLREQDDDDDNDNKDSYEESKDKGWDPDDHLKIINGDDGKMYGVEAKDGDNEVTRYYDDKEEAEEAYEDLDRDELTHQDKSFNDWEYDDEEHPSLR